MEIFWFADQEEPTHLNNLESQVKGSLWLGIYEVERFWGP